MPTTYKGFINEAMEDGMSKFEAERYWLEVEADHFSSDDSWCEDDNEA